MNYFAIPKLQQQHEWYIEKAIRIPESINTLGSELDQKKNQFSCPTRHSNYLLSLIPSKYHTTEIKENKKETCSFNLLSQTGEKYYRQKGNKCIEVNEEKTFDEEKTSDEENTPDGEKTNADDDECYKDKAVNILTTEYTGSSI